MIPEKLVPHFKPGKALARSGRRTAAVIDPADGDLHDTPGATSARARAAPPARIAAGVAMRILDLARSAALHLLHAVRVRAEQPARRRPCTGSSARSGARRWSSSCSPRSALGCAFGVLRDGAELVAPSPRRAQPHAAAADAAIAEPAHRAAGHRRRAAAARAVATRRAMDFDLQWLLLGAADRVRARLDRPRAWTCGQWRREQTRVAEGLLQGPEPAAQRAARQGDRRLHRGGAAATPTPPSCTSRSATCSAAAASSNARCACTSTCCNAPTCGAAERDRAQHALAQDFMKAGLLDRAEQRLPRSSKARSYRHRSAPRAAVAGTSARATGAPRPRCAAKLEQPAAPARTRLAHRAPLVRAVAARPTTTSEPDCRRRCAAGGPARPRRTPCAADHRGAVRRAGRPTRRRRSACTASSAARACAVPLVASDYATAAIQCGQAEAARATVLRRAARA